jgi:hypothetical protein
MANTYKKEYIEKVKQKFNDVQTSKNIGGKSVELTPTDKRREVCNAERVAKTGGAK